MKKARSHAHTQRLHVAMTDSSISAMNAFLKYPDASIESLDYESRDMTREVIIHFAKMSFVETATNLVVPGPAGAGKTYLACALGVEACKHSYRTFYIRMSDFLRIMDEWLSHILSEKEAKNLYELLELRKGVNPTRRISEENTMR